MSMVDSTDDEWVLLTVALALEEIPCQTTVMAVLNCDKFDWLSTVSVVSRHYSILIDILESDPTKDTLLTIQKAVEIHPVLEVVIR